MTSAWTNFATYGDPTPHGSGQSWIPVNKDHQVWNISDPSPIMTTPLEIWKRMEIWDDVMQNFTKK